MAHRPATSQTDRRRQTRYAVKCRVVAIAADEADGLVQPVSIDARAEDLSLGGAKLVTTQPFPSSRLWIRFTGNDGPSELVECRVVRFKTRIANAGAAQQDCCQYGLRFCRELTEAQLAQFVDRGAVEESA